MFVAGMSNIAEPPINDLWTVPGEESLLEQWVKEDTDFFQTIDMRFSVLPRVLSYVSSQVGVF